MEFLQHFLPGQPLEENGHTSLGVISTATFERSASAVVLGLDLEVSDSFLKQTQFGPTEGSPFLMETRPEGKHYDYEVTTMSIAPFVQGQWSPNDRLQLHAGLRLEYLEHDYDNLMLSGNTRDDGTPCGFGGCLYTRPESRSDSFANVAPKFALNYELSESLVAYANLARGFRAPQATELYRLQSGQQVADLESERIDSLELGLRFSADDWSIDTAAYFMRKRGSVLRDADGFNISNGKTRHEGIESDLTWRVHPWWQLSANVSYARHKYDFNLVAARGETFVSGRTVDTAPRWLGSIDLLFQPNDYLDANLQWTAIGEYYLDAENRFTYPGHDVLNLRLNMRLTRSFNIIARMNNITDELIADRADYAFGNYRYFPGRGRELFLELRYARRESL
jgi:outer membrane receptor protein involved in Fe transport